MPHWTKQRVRCECRSCFDIRRNPSPDIPHVHRAGVQVASDGELGAAGFERCEWMAGCCHELLLAISSVSVQPISGAIMSRRLEGKVGIITGSSSGMGKTTALQFAREGAKVIIAARREQESREVVKEITDNGGEAMFVRTDVSVWSDVENMVQKTMDHYGRLDCAFNNAGLSARLTEDWLGLTEEQWDQTADINLKGVWMCMRHQIPAMLESGGGVIVNNSSLLGERGAGSAPYAATKHGVIGLTRSAAVTFGDKNIRVNAVLPGIIMTPIVQARIDQNPELAEKAGKVIPLGEMGPPESVADAVTWLCSDESAYITGQTLTIDGGVLAQMLPKMT